MVDFIWLEAEKRIARRAFDAALKRECAALVDNLKVLAAKAEVLDDAWAIKDTLTARQKSMDEKYEYRYSQLVLLFGCLLREGWLEEIDIEGLGEEKLQAIRLVASH